MDDSKKINKGYLHAVVDVTDSHRTISPISYRLMEHGIKNYITSRNVPPRPFIGVPLRMMGWKAKLLDISLSSNLVDMKGKSVIQLNIWGDEEISNLQDSLVWGNALTIRFASPSPKDAELDLMTDRISVPPLERDSMNSLNAEITVNLKETGIGGGCVGLGAVVWTDKKGNNHTAPLVLVSVSISKLNSYSYRIKHPDYENAAINVVLLERLRSEFGITVPPLDIFIEDGTVDIRGLFDMLSSSCDIAYRPEAFIGSFSLDRNAMWSDIDRNFSGMLENPIIRRMTDGESLGDIGHLGVSYDLTDLHPVLPVDSSQISAINAALSGTSFVLRGPPGTGKSQTITNIICELILREKTVLFVSEKVPALEVIVRQLAEVGVSDFCLGIYGKEKKNNTFVDRILDNYNSATSDWDFLDDDEEIQSVTIDALDKYYEVMFGENFNGSSFYQLYNRQIRSHHLMNYYLSSQSQYLMSCYLSYCPSHHLCQSYYRKDFLNYYQNRNLRSNLNRCQFLR